MLLVLPAKHIETLAHRITYFSQNYHLLPGLQHGLLNRVPKPFLQLPILTTTQFGRESGPVKTPSGGVTTTTASKPSHCLSSQRKAKISQIHRLHLNPHNPYHSFIVNVLPPSLSKPRPDTWAGTLQIQVLREWNETNLYFLHVFLLKCHSVMKQLLATLPKTAMTSLWFTCLHAHLSQGKQERGMSTPSATAITVLGVPLTITK